MSEKMCVAQKADGEVFATVAQSQRPTAVSDIRLSSRSPRLVECVCVLLLHMPWIAEVCVWSLCVADQKSTAVSEPRRSHSYTHTHVALSEEVAEVTSCGTEVRGLGRWVCVWMRGR